MAKKTTTKTATVKTTKTSAKKPVVKKAEKKVEPKVEVKAEKVKKVTIGSVAIKALNDGLGAEGALAAVKKQFPDGNTKMASIYWYASQEGIKLQGTAKPKAEKVVHKVAVQTKKNGQKVVKAMPKEEVKAPAKQMITIGKAGKVGTKKATSRVDADAEAADKAARNVA